MMSRPTSAPTSAAESAKTASERRILRQQAKQNIKPPQDTAILAPEAKRESTSSKNTFDVKKYFPNDISRKLKETKGTRIVELHKYASRRQELLEQNKPVATYKRTILMKWKASDFLLQRDLFTARRLAKLRAPTVFKDSRSVKMWWLTDKLKSSMSSSHRKDRWWIVADTTVLLHDMYFIRELIKSDESIRMRMPYEVLHDLTAMTAKNNRAWVRIPARKLLTFIERYEGRDNLIIGQGAVDAEDLLDHPLATDAVLNCCMQYLRLYYYVVLISDDPVRKKKAKSIGMPCYTLQEVRDLVLPKYSNYREGKCQITIKVSSIPAAPSVPSQGYFLMPPPLHASIGWPSCMKLPPDLTTTASSHIRGAGQTITAPPDHTMTGPFGYTRATSQTITAPPDHTLTGPFGYTRAPSQTITAPPDHKMAGPFGYTQATSQTITAPPDHKMAGPFGYTRAAGQSMNAPPVLTMAGPFGHIRPAGQTMTVSPVYTMAGSFGHIRTAGQTMTVPPVHTMAGSFGHIRTAGQTMTVPPVHTMAGSFGHIRTAGQTMTVPPVHTMADSFGHIRTAGQTMTVPPVHTMAGSFDHIRDTGPTMTAPPDHTMAAPFGPTMTAPPDHAMVGQSCHTTKSSTVNRVVPLRPTNGAPMRPTSHVSNTKHGHTNLSVTLQVQTTQHYTFYHPR